MLSQVGIKNNILNHKESHPYWETADYQTLCGFNEYLIDVGYSKADERVTIFIAPYDEQISHNPFPNQQEIARRVGVVVDSSSVTPFEIEKIDIITPKWVRLDERSAFSGLLRSELLPAILNDCSACIIVGGGKATSHLMAQAKFARKMIIIAPACNCRSFSSNEESYFKESGAFQAYMKDIAFEGDGDILKVSGLVVDRIPQIIEVLKVDMSMMFGKAAATGSLMVDKRIQSLQRDMLIYNVDVEIVPFIFRLLYSLARIGVHLYQNSRPFFFKNEAEFRGFLASNLRFDMRVRDNIAEQHSIGPGKIDISCFGIPIEVKRLRPNQKLGTKLKKVFVNQASEYGVITGKRISFLCVLHTRPVPIEASLPDHNIYIEKGRNEDPVICIEYYAMFVPPSVNAKN